MVHRYDRGIDEIQVRLQRSAPVLGLEAWLDILLVETSWPLLTSRVSADYKNVKDSPLFTDPDPISGFGTWGDPNNDFQITDGGFANIEHAYPIPHRLRRNYTLQPWLQIPQAAFPSMTEPSLEANASLSPKKIQELIDHTPGDFAGFQMRMEAQVGPHGNGHQIVGG